MEEERFFPLPEKDPFRILNHAGFKSLSEMSCRMSASLRPCFPTFMSFIPLFFCWFLTARSVTLSGHTESWEVFSNLGHVSPGSSFCCERAAEALHGAPQVCWIGHLATNPRTFQWHQQALNTMLDLQNSEWHEVTPKPVTRQEKKQRWRIVSRVKSCVTVGLCGVTHSWSPQARCLLTQGTRGSILLVP